MQMVVVMVVVMVEWIDNVDVVEEPDVNTFDMKAAKFTVGCICILSSGSTSEFDESLKHWSTLCTKQVVTVATLMLFIVAGVL